MRRQLWAVAGRAGTAGLLAITLSPFAGPQEKAQEFHGMGCVQPGVETRCLEVTDVHTGVLFDLFIRGVQPAMGTGIEFIGLPHRGVTTCTQGTQVDVKTWIHRDLKCVQGTAPKPKH
jgi:hypothetical protein